MRFDFDLYGDRVVRQVNAHKTRSQKRLFTAGLRRYAPISECGRSSSTDGCVHVHSMHSGRCIRCGRFVLCVLQVKALQMSPNEKSTFHCRRGRSGGRSARIDSEAIGGREEDVYITIGSVTVKLAVAEIMERPTPLQQPPPPGEAHALPAKTRIEPQTMLLASERHATRSTPSMKQTVAAYSAQRHSQYGPEQ